MFSMRFFLLFCDLFLFLNIWCLRCHGSNVHHIWKLKLQNLPWKLVWSLFFFQPDPPKSRFGNMKADWGSLFLEISFMFSLPCSRMSYFNCFQASSLRALLSTTNWGVQSILFSWSIPLEPLNSLPALTPQRHEDRQTFTFELELARSPLDILCFYFC